MLIVYQCLNAPNLFDEYRFGPVSRARNDVFCLPSNRISHQCGCWRRISSVVVDVLVGVHPNEPVDHVI